MKAVSAGKESVGAETILINGKEALFMNFEGLSADESIDIIVSFRKYMTNRKVEDRLVLANVRKSPISKRGIDAWMSLTKTERLEAKGAAIYGASAFLRFTVSAFIMVVKTWNPNIDATMKMFADKKDALAWLESL